LTTWGDLNYLGLAGIEVYDSEGQPIQPKKISACPPDINVLPGYGNDPRVVENLVDGHYFTNDDMDVWLTPFTSGDDHTVTLDFGQKTQISMIRIWNYNKSRIHAYRGA
jgi:protein JBTS26